MEPATQNISLEDFLADPAFERYEFADGAIWDATVGNPRHSLIQGNCARILGQFLRKTRRGWMLTEARYRLPLGGRSRVYLPDVCIVLSEPDALDKPYLERAPELVVEIKSPDDSTARLLQKVEDYLEAGTQVAWVILPAERAVLVCRPGAEPERFGSEAALNGEPAVAGLRISVAELFEE